MKIVFVVAFQFPYGSASSMRARHLYELFESIGHNVYVISDYNSSSQITSDKNYSYESIFDNQVTFLKRLRVAKKSVKALKLYCEKNSVDCIVMNANFDRFSQIASYCNKKNIRLVVENCEWYDSSAFKLGKLDFRYYLNQRMITKKFKKADGFISISRFLHEHNQQFNKPSIRIPTILDVKNTTFSKKVKNKKLIIAYTGHPERSKEFLLPMIQVLAENKAFAERIEFHIYGPNDSEVLCNIGNRQELLERTKECVFIHGQVPQKEIENILLNIDYLLFLRPNRRSSTAGFPTKLGESFAVGTPVITNETGDIGLYVENYKNGFLVDSHDVDSLRKTIEKILSIDAEERENIRLNARKTAEKFFDFRIYSEQLRDYFEEF